MKKTRSGGTLVDHRRLDLARSQAIVVREVLDGLARVDPAHDRFRAYPAADDRGAAERDSGIDDDEPCGGREVTRKEGEQPRGQTLRSAIDAREVGFEQLTDCDLAGLERLMSCPYLSKKISPALVRSSSLRSSRSSPSCSSA